MQMQRTPFRPRVAPMAGAKLEASVAAELARRGLRRGRRFRAGVGLVFDPGADAAQRALAGVARKLEAAVAAPMARKVLPTPRPTPKQTDAALLDARAALDRLLGRRRR